MRLLWLGGSNDDYGSIPEGERGFSIARRILAEASGEEVDLVRKHIWPTTALVPLVERWMRESTPDLVYLKANTYWTCYVSVAARVERRWGRRSERAVLKGQRILGEGWLPEGPLWRIGRRLGQRLLGTAPYFETGEVVRTMDGILRAVLREEGVAAVVRGGFPPIGVQAGRAREVADGRFAAMHDELSELCARLHVPFLEDERYLSDDEVRALKGADLTHPNPAGHARTGALDGKALVDAWRASRA